LQKKEDWLKPIKIKKHVSAGKKTLYEYDIENNNIEAAESVKMKSRKTELY
jgi:hypothetical protein